MPLIIISAIIQIACAYHVVSTGRDKYWIFLILMAPGIGSAIYFFTQILPDMGSSSTARQVKQGAVKAIDPLRELREAQRDLDMVESVENRLRLADALIRLEKWDEAEPYVATSLVGAHKHDPHILMKMARIKLEQKHPSETIALLDQLQEFNKDFQSQDGHLLYSRALAEAGREEEALGSYEQLTSYAAGEEARVRYGLLLKQCGHMAEAEKVFAEVEARVSRGTKFYKKNQSKWLNIARHASKLS